VDLPQNVINEFVEDTLEIFALVMKQVIAQMDKRNERGDSGSSYLLHINTQSPNNEQVGDLFRFNAKEQQAKKNVRGASFFDRIAFTQ
jgi:hypothetical protein